MLQSIAKLLEAVIKPETDWGRFTRKLIGLVASASIGAVIWNVYFNYRISQTGERSVGEVLQRKPAKRPVVRQLLERIMSSDSKIRSVWLYSWPDATNLSPIMYVGDAINPLPFGTFRPGDEHAVGSFVLGLCAEIDRPLDNYSCPVSGFENSWGIIVVRYSSNYSPAESDRRGIEALAKKMGIILYSNKSHNGTL